MSVDFSDDKSTLFRVIAWCHQAQAIAWANVDPYQNVIRCHWATMNLSYFSVLSVLTSYRKTSNISRTLVGHKIVDNSDVVGASPVGAAPTTSSFST